ncbi:hypothetical protein ASPCADRAFT_211917, partial [Aspergillus carbonarius ITEM 5010]
MTVETKIPSAVTQDNDQGEQTLPAAVIILEECRPRDSTGSYQAFAAWDQFRHSPKAAYSAL